MSLDDDLLAEVDAAAQKAGLSRSAWLARQAEIGLGGPLPSRAERVNAAIAEIQRIYRSAPRTDAPILPTAVELKRMREERTDKIERAARTRRATKR